jgi:hypothetical protein
MPPISSPSPHGSTRVASGKAFNNTANTQSRLQRRINDTARLQREAIMDLQRLEAARPHPNLSRPLRNPLNLNLLHLQLGSSRKPP